MRWSLPAGLGKAGPRHAHSLFPVAVGAQGLFPGPLKVSYMFPCGAQSQRKAPSHTAEEERQEMKWNGLICFHDASTEKWKRQILSQKELKAQVTNTVNHFLCEEPTGSFCSLPFYFKFGSTSFHLSCYHCSSSADAMSWQGQQDTHFTKQTASLPHPASSYARHRVLETRNDGKSDPTWQRREILY